MNQNHLSLLPTIRWNRNGERHPEQGLHSFLASSRVNKVVLPVLHSKSRTLLVMNLLSLSCCSLAKAHTSVLPIWAVLGCWSGRTGHYHGATRFCWGARASFFSPYSRDMQHPALFSIKIAKRQRLFVWENTDVQLLTQFSCAPSRKYLIVIHISFPNRRTVIVHLQRTKVTVVYIQ